MSTPKKVTRPLMEIDWKKISDLCAAGASGVSIAMTMGFSEETLYHRCKRDHGMDFTSYRRQHLVRGDDSIRAKQFEVAMKGDKSMLIWLGKQRLGQRDRFDFSGSAASAPPPVINIVVQPPRPQDDSGSGI